MTPRDAVNVLLDAPKGREALRVLLDLVSDLTYSEECWFDHHGYCQAHDWLTEGTCPHARAQTVVGMLDDMTHLDYRALEDSLKDFTPSHFIHDGDVTPIAPDDEKPFREGVVEGRKVVVDAHDMVGEGLPHQWYLSIRVIGGEPVAMIGASSASTLTAIGEGILRAVDDAQREEGS